MAANEVVLQLDKLAVWNLDVTEAPKAGGDAVDRAPLFGDALDYRTRHPHALDRRGREPHPRPFARHRDDIGDRQGRSAQHDGVCAFTGAMRAIRMCLLDGPFAICLGIIASPRFAAP